MSILEIAPLVRGAYLAARSVPVILSPSDEAELELNVESVDQLAGAFPVELPDTVAVTVAGERHGFRAHRRGGVAAAARQGR